MRKRPLGSSPVAAALVLVVVVAATTTTTWAWLAAPHQPRGRPAVVRIASVELAMAKKKKAMTAALDVLEALEEELLLNGDTPLSKKEQLKLAKQQQQQQQPVNNNNNKNGISKEQLLAVETEAPPLSAKELKLQRALELEAADEARQMVNEAAEPALSKKELLELKKKQEKMAAKLAKKEAKKQQQQQQQQSGTTFAEEEEETTTVLVNGSNANGDPTSDDGDDNESSSESNTVTLEDKIRRERPPPRIRVMEQTNQPGYTSLRLENVGITFRNQQVLRDVTWGVQTGDRIGLVGANGAGECVCVCAMCVWCSVWTIFCDDCCCMGVSSVCVCV